MVLQKHTDREYELELETLRERVLFMGAQVEGLIETAIEALKEMSVQTAMRAIAADSEIDDLEVEIDELGLRLLARRQPVASDLRFITTTFKLVTDLERAGDLAVNIAERVVELTNDPHPPQLSANLWQMAQVAHAMLKDALDAFVTEDVLKAVGVTERDSAVDAFYAQLFPELVAKMVSDTRNVVPATRLQSIGKCIERIADHATNIAEMVIFMVRGQDVRHHHGLLRGGSGKR
ncbi:MAG: phosphate signaling complex protein PhoU [Polyangiaceae bacterium]